MKKHPDCSDCTHEDIPQYERRQVNKGQIGPWIRATPAGSIKNALDALNNVECVTVIYRMNGERSTSYGEWRRNW